MTNQLPILIPISPHVFYATIKNIVKKLEELEIKVQIVQTSIIRYSLELTFNQPMTNSELIQIGIIIGNIESKDLDK